MLERCLSDLEKLGKLNYFRDKLVLTGIQFGCYVITVLRVLSTGSRHRNCSDEMT